MKAASVSPNTFRRCFGERGDISSAWDIGKPPEGFDLDWDSPLALRRSNLNCDESKWFRERVRELLKGRITIEKFGDRLGVSKRNVEMRLSPSGGRLQVKTADRFRAEIEKIVPFEARTSREQRILWRMEDVLEGRRFSEASREYKSAAIIIDRLVQRGLVASEQAQVAFIYGLDALQKTALRQDQLEAALNRLCSLDRSDASLFGFKQMLEAERDWPGRTG